MKCPFYSSDTDVIDSRLSESGAHFVRRRRVCQKQGCGMRFTTIELPTISAHSSDDITKWVGAQKRKGRR